MVRWQVMRKFSKYWIVLGVLILLLIIKLLFSGNQIDYKSYKAKGYFSSQACKPLERSSATIDTLSLYPKLNFDAPPSRSFWTDKYEERSKKRADDPGANPLKVFILPHSHNDPGWLKTFTNYFESDTKKILDLVVQKLTEYDKMTFVWTEISFLDLWWQQASEAQKEAFKKLVNEGRLDIMTGGWVMTDEANSHYHAMLDQLIEGHQWVKTNLDFIPKSAWSIDPFGQGSTVPHLLAASGLSGAIIQRIHYSWKEYFAWNQSGDFHWKTLWNNQQSPKYTMLTHNMPFDIYSTKHSCGPHPDNCLKFEFRKVPGTWVESRAEDITDENVQGLADILVKQYQDTASLFSHNVAFVLVGGDFTYNVELEFQQQYVNYKKLIDYVNSQGDRYKNTKLQFGTPTDYFQEISKRMDGKFPSLVGDFFPYSDIFSSGMPAYWTGYFTTRPFHKMMSRDLEHNLRNAEILYTIAYNTGRHLKNFRDERILEKDYELIVKARRNLGLFQHHDAITGTSKKHVTNDYLERLLTSIKDTLRIQRNVIESIVQSNDKKRIKNFLSNEFVHETIEKSPSKKVIDVKKDEDVEIFIYNSLAQRRELPISLHISSSNVKVLSSKGYELSYQVNQVLGTNFYELIFIPKLSGLSINSFVLSYNANIEGKMGQITSDANLENDRLVLSFNETSGMLSSMFDKKSAKGSIVKISFGAYKSQMSSSGAYLFKPSNEISNFMSDLLTEVVITKGPLAEDVTVIRDKFLVHKVRIYNSKTYLDEAISIVNDIDFGPSPSNNNVEMFMKIRTSIKNGNPEPGFFTDQNGFHWQERRKVSSLGIEANYFPITTLAFMQDNVARLSIMTTHAQGAASLNQGEIEIMLDRRTAMDDGRGMGEGVYDSIKMQHKFYLTMEYFEENFQKHGVDYQVPSLLVQHLTNVLNYPTNVFVNDKLKALTRNEIELLQYKIPCDHHLVNLRTLTDDELEWLPSRSALLIIHRYGYSCEFNNEYLTDICDSSDELNSLQFINGLKVAAAERTSLTALKKKYEIEIFNEPLEAMEIRTYNITFG